MIDFISFLKIVGWVYIILIPLWAITGCGVQHYSEAREIATEQIKNLRKRKHRRIKRAIAQRAEHLLYMERVSGSKPLGPIKLIVFLGFCFTMVCSLGMMVVILLLPIDSIPIPINIWTKIGIGSIFIYFMIGLDVSLFRIIEMK